MRLEAEIMGLVISTNDRYTHLWYEKLFYHQELYIDFVPLEVSFFNFGWEGSLTPIQLKMYHFKK
jgi:hypothetical protein